MKNRYSDDLTIEVVGDTQTVNIKDNANITGDLAVGGTITADFINISGAIEDNVTIEGDLSIDGTISVTSDINADGNVTIGGDLTVEGDLTLDDITSNTITGDNYLYGSEISKGVFVDFSSLSEIQTQSWVYADFYYDSQDDIYIRCANNESPAVQWYIYIKLDNLNYISSASIAGIKLVMLNDTSQTDFNVSASLQRRSFTEGAAPSSWSIIASDSASVDGSDTTNLQHLTFTYTPAEDITNLISNSHRLMFVATSKELKIYKILIALNVQNMHTINGTSASAII
jgi:hypothetical protein